jgi:hypothetical protein
MNDVNVTVDKVATDGSKAVIASNKPVAPGEKVEVVFTQDEKTVGEAGAPKADVKN